MSESKTSQTQHDDAFDPLKVWTSSMETWTQMARDNIGRMPSFFHRSGDDRRSSMAFWNTGLDAWTQLACDGIERLQSFYSQVAEIESAAYERARKSARDLGDMMSESVTYAADLTREWQQLGLETVRRGVHTVRSRREAARDSE
jgi:hypothetical protein